jgi:hypothetical protein
VSEIESFHAQKWVDVGKGGELSGGYVPMTVEKVLPPSSLSYDGGTDEAQI